MQIQPEPSFGNEAFSLASAETRTTQEIAEITLQSLIKSGQGYSKAALHLKDSIVRTQS